MPKTPRSIDDLIEEYGKPEWVAEGRASIRKDQIRAIAAAVIRECVPEKQTSILQKDATVFSPEEAYAWINGANFGRTEMLRMAKEMGLSV